MFDGLWVGDLPSGHGRLNVAEAAYLAGISSRHGCTTVTRPASTAILL
ncbi:Hypothetical protein A7982_07970 [Minicystis rosea]|nr:Hypothetical protein A7982_07970 [Minicystis rosea]